jgi:hypothetical protein
VAVVERRAPMELPPVEAPVVVPVKVEPTTATLTLAADPANAHVNVNGVDLTCNPCELSGNLGSRQTARVTADGMSPVSLELVFDKDRTEHVALVAAPAEAAPVVDAGKLSKPGKKKPGKGGLSVDEKNPYE